MTKFKSIELGELAAEGRSVISGPFGSNIGLKFFEEVGVPVIRGNNLTTDYQKFIDDGFVFVSEEKANELKSDALIGDIIFTAAGTIGQVGIIPHNAKFKRYVISNKQMRFRVDNKKADVNFVYYWLASPWIKDTLISRNTGSTVPLINLGIIKKLPINLPESIEEQKKIASVLSTLDEKIALNNQINATLEQMAKTLYDYWFVQFDFPDDNGKPYKSSGGEMVYNKTLKRDIPKGWEVKKLVEIEKNIVTGKTPPTSNPEFFGDEIPFITISDIRNNTVIVDNEQFLSRKGADYQKGKYLPSGSLCVSCIATVGLIGFTTRKSQTNQQINSIIFKHGFNRVFLFFALNNYFSVAKAKTGNTFANMNKADFEEINVVYPPIDVLKSFQDKVSNQFNLIKNQSKQNGELTKLRDWLLPMLMNGQVTVQ